MCKRAAVLVGLMVMSLGLPLQAMEDGSKLAAKLKKHHQGKAYEGQFHMLFNTENNGIPVKATTESKVGFKDPNHLAITSTLDFEIPALPKQPGTDIHQVHDGKRMWLDVKIGDFKNSQVLTISLKNIAKVRNAQGQLSFMPGKPGAVDPMSLILQYLTLFPWRIEKTEGDWATLYTELPSLMWHQFGVVDPEGAKIDFSSVRIEANTQTNAIRAVRIGKGEKAHMNLTVKSYEQVAKNSFAPERFQYKPPTGANINDLDVRLGLAKPKTPAPQKAPVKEPDPKKTETKK
ncbi:hypothetical protein [Acanthopleuribacter pedis]|uniref:Uncharacterized protein n=1 Tax=Acanthopleuribacter pedis TaxID=442870 RepID=A0A8J7Q7W7_9BACT|nr:hypothetical protein [Acanthopleuribacter pedis]MBO1322387.1 hypothetical protein [Acanthopleuribacter pedis]